MYYPSKEVCIYEVLKRNEAELFARMELIMAKNMRDKARFVQFLREVFLAADSLILYLCPKDFEVLLRKLPPEYREREDKKSDDYFECSLKLLKVDKNKMEAIAMLTDCLNTVATNSVQ